MASEQWWAVLLDGSVGALLGLVGVFLALWLTRGHERSLAEVALEQAEADRLKMRQDEALAAVAAAATSFMRHAASTRWVRRVRLEVPLTELFHAVFVFGAAFSGEQHALRRMWLIDRAALLARDVKEVERGWLMPGQSRRIEMALNVAGELELVMGRLLSEELPDEEFRRMRAEAPRKGFTFKGKWIPATRS
jgi:hypothetical protein